MKKFPKEKHLRVGKYVAQGAHASLASILSIGRIEGDNLIVPLTNPFIKEWITGPFKKIACYVETDHELIEIYETARKAGLPCCIIKDSGLTEFNGVPTLTAVGVGPGDDIEINKVTGHLPLF